MTLNIGYHPYSKESQLANHRQKPTQKQLGAISPKVRKEVKERSGGICEVRKRCNGDEAVQQAHIIGRKQLTAKTTISDLLHVCYSCHQWLDQTPEGIRYRRSLKEGKQKMKGWIGKPSPKSRHVGDGWFGEMNRCYVDEAHKYCVMIRTIQTEWGVIEHACIRNAPNTDIPWSEKQRIKNEIFGAERTAVEVFPVITKLVDQANMYHLWVLPVGFIMPFSIGPE